MTSLAVLEELLISKGLAVRVGTETTTLPVLVMHRMPEDTEFNHVITVAPYNRTRDRLQLSTEEHSLSLLRRDMQVFYRNTGDFDTIEEAFDALLIKLVELLPYESLDKSWTIDAMYRRSGPIRYLVDRHARSVYLANVRLVFHNAKSSTGV